MSLETFNGESGQGKPTNSFIGMDITVLKEERKKLAAKIVELEDEASAISAGNPSDLSEFRTVNQKLTEKQKVFNSIQEAIKLGEESLADAEKVADQLEQAARMG